VLAVITFGQILELLLLIIIVHVVLLAPLMVALVGAWLDRQANEAIRNAPKDY
jgi:hypothetical protein